MPAFKSPSPVPSVDSAICWSSGRLSAIAAGDLSLLISLINDTRAGLTVVLWLATSNRINSRGADGPGMPVSYCSVFCNRAASIEENCITLAIRPGSLTYVRGEQLAVSHRVLRHHHAGVGFLGQYPKTGGPGKVAV